LVDKKQVDHLLATQCGRPDFPISVIGGHLEGTDPPETGPAARSQWSAERVYRRLGQGATIRIGNMPHFIPAIRRLASCLETALSSDIAINLYLTPPMARAFGAHYDNHDVFILQVEGSKSWTLRSPAEHWPLETVFRGREQWLRRSLPWETKLKTLPPVEATRSYRLEAGDMLYVPRGHVHEVKTQESESLHLTVAAPVVTWYEVAVDSVLAAARRSPELREALPPGFATDPEARAEAMKSAPAAIEALRAQLGADDLGRSLSRIADQFVHSREGDWQGAAEDRMRADSIGTGTMLAIRPGLACTSRESGADLLLLFAGRVVRLPVRASTMIDHILEARRFRVGDLPTHLGDESRIVVARILVENGMLTLDA
ncbi:MAG TPA: cupin domain-containing protein, partial [Allosphingosinicella sp.]|nr:cupin domain-containing protein [Allosphingosinicella sp.]